MQFILLKNDNYENAITLVAGSLNGDIKHILDACNEIGYELRQIISEDDIVEGDLY